MIYKTFCTNNPDIIFTKTDKGNIILNKYTYISKIKEIFDDPNTYTKIPINKKLYSHKKSSRTIITLKK